MAVNIQVRRGTKAQLDGITLAAGELGFTTDTNELWVGDGSNNLRVGRVLVDTYANIPAAGEEGRLFFATDQGTLYVDDGDSWEVAGGGGVTTGTSFPGSPSDGDLFWHETQEVLYLYSSTAEAWIDLTSGGAGSKGFNWTIEVAATTNQAPTVDNMLGRYYFTTATVAARTVTLPSVGVDEDGGWFAITNQSAYTITITAADSDTIGWPKLHITAIEILPNTHISLRYDHTLTKWEIVQKVGGQVRPSGTVLYLPMNRMDFEYSNGSGNVFGALKDDTENNMIYTANGTNAYIVSDSSYSKFRNSCATFNGSSGFFSSVDSSDWDVFGSLSNDCTVCGWVFCLSAIGSSQMFVDHYEDNNNRWQLYRNAAGALYLYYVSTGSGQIDSGGGTVTSNVWKHVALCKIGSEVGLYIDGSQVMYDGSFVADTFAGYLYFGQIASGNYFNGRMEDWAIVYHNIFGAAPNSTPNDSFTLDTVSPLGLVI